MGRSPGRNGVVFGAGALVSSRLLGELDDKVGAGLVLLRRLEGRVGQVVLEVHRLPDAGGAGAPDRAGGVEESVVGQHAHQTNGGACEKRFQTGGEFSVKRQQQVIIVNSGTIFFTCLLVGTLNYTQGAG